MNESDHMKLAIGTEWITNHEIVQNDEFSVAFSPAAWAGLDLTLTVTCSYQIEYSWQAQKKISDKTTKLKLNK